MDRGWISLHKKIVDEENHEFLHGENSMGKVSKKVNGILHVKKVNNGHFGAYFLKKSIFYRLVVNANHKWKDRTLISCKIKQIAVYNFLQITIEYA